MDRTLQQLLSCILLTLSLLVIHHARAADEPLVRKERAIGGFVFERGEWPWLALMKATMVKERLFGFWPVRHSYVYCGGVLVSRRWILTAAHCFTQNGFNDPSLWEARLGAVRIRASAGQRLVDILGRILDDDALRQWDIDVEKIVVHPNYNPSNDYSNDIALIRLSRDIPRTDNISPITLPTPFSFGFPADGLTCVTKGWGCTSKGGAISQRARAVKLPIYSSWRCSRLYGIRYKDFGRRLCAGYRYRGVGVCHGDSGSPLVCPHMGRYTLAGIVSFAMEDRPAQYPAAFTRVSSYLPWIHNVISR